MKKTVWLYSFTTLCAFAKNEMRTASGAQDPIGACVSGAFCTAARCRWLP